MSTVSAPFRHGSSTWGKSIVSFRESVDFCWTQEQFALDADISRRTMQRLEKTAERKQVKPKDLDLLAAGIDKAAEFRTLDREWVGVWKDHLFRQGERPPDLAGWLESRKASVEPEGTTEAADRNSSRQQPLDPASLPIRSLGFYNDKSATPEDESVKRLLLDQKKLVKVTVIEDFGTHRTVNGNRQNDDTDFGIGRTFLTRADGLRWWIKNVEQPNGKQYLIFAPEDLEAEVGAG